jgi:antitoxin component HigA of HigAB toxin-antitoxin module
VTSPAGPAADVAAVLAALLATRDLQAGDLARQAGCTASHVSHILHRRTRPLVALATRLDTALNAGGQVTAALARTPAPLLTRSRPRPARTAQ